MKSTLVRWGTVALMIGTLAGCGGGGGGGAGTAVPAAGGAAAGSGSTVSQTVTPPSGTAQDASTFTTDQFAALAPAGAVTSVSIASPIVVTFQITDANGRGIKGLGFTSKSATALYPGLTNLAFSVAKLVPGADGSPSKWVSYIVTSSPTTTTGEVPSRPSTDNIGTLVDNGDGTYKYTFRRDITTVKDLVAAATVTLPNNVADLGDLTYDPAKLHRLVIQVSGYARGTSTNTADGSNSGVQAVAMDKPLNIIFDWWPGTGRVVQPTDTDQREIVSVSNCFQCHGKFSGFHVAGVPAGETPLPAARQDTRMCVVCHTDQRRYGRTEATIAGLTFSGSTYLVDGRAVGNLPNHIHKTHMGHFLSKTGYNYGGLLYNEVKFPQDIRNCTKCHDGSANATNRTAQGDNWKNVPSRLACGACHDGINFATGRGVTHEDAMKGLTTSQYGHIGGAQADDSKCALCHNAASIDIYHLPVTAPNEQSALHVTGGSANTNAAWIASNTNRLPAGAIKVTYDISSVSRNASKQPVMVFRMLQNGTAVPLNDKATKTEIWDNFMGSPSVYFVFAVPQDGITAPADFNATASTYLRSLWNGTASGGSAGTLTGPDASGYYTATLTGVTIPDSAVMLTGGLGYSYNVRSTLPLTQTNLADYPTSAATAPGETNQIGGLIVIAPNVTRVATGYTGRRAIVEDARCNKCHQELGVFTHETFHGGQRNDAPTCSWCHNPNRTSSGWAADSTAYIHAIHAAAKRTKPFTWHALSTTESFADIGFPGILKNCETCHLPGTYDFSASASASALPNRLYRTVATGIFRGTEGTTITTYSYSSATGTCVAGTSSAQTALGVFSLSPYITALTNYGIGFSYNAGLTTANSCKPDGTLVANPAGGTVAADGTTLVNSPIATACFACHDGDLAKSHMQSNGGSIYAPRSTALATTEQCTLCHLAGRVADIKAMHAK